MTLGNQAALATGSPRGIIGRTQRVHGGMSMG